MVNWALSWINQGEGLIELRGEKSRITDVSSTNTSDNFSFNWLCLGLVCVFKEESDEALE